MRFKEFIISEGVAQVFKDFEKWAAAVRKLGAKTVKSHSGRKIYAVDDPHKISGMKKLGEWNERENEGYTFDIRQKMLKAEITLESDDISDQVPYGKNEEIRKLIKKGAMDPEHSWTNALDLVHRAYEVAEVERPVPSMRDAWDQYEENILYSVQMLQKSTEKGMRDNSWKTQSLT
jgi:hypothetical protein